MQRCWRRRNKTAGGWKEMRAWLEFVQGEGRRSLWVRDKYSSKEHSSNPEMSSLTSAPQTHQGVYNTAGCHEWESGKWCMYIFHDDCTLLSYPAYTQCKLDSSSFPSWKKKPGIIRTHYLLMFLTIYGFDVSLAMLAASLTWAMSLNLLI